MRESVLEDALQSHSGPVTIDSESLDPISNKSTCQTEEKDYKSLYENLMKEHTEVLKKNVDLKMENENLQKAVKGRLEENSSLCSP